MDAYPLTKKVFEESGKAPTIHNLKEEIVRFQKSSGSTHGVEPLRSYGGYLQRLEDVLYAASRARGESDDRPRWHVDVRRSTSRAQTAVAAATRAASQLPRPTTAPPASEKWERASTWGTGTVPPLASSSNRTRRRQEGAAPKPTAWNAKTQRQRRPSRASLAVNAVAPWPPARRAISKPIDADRRNGFLLYLSDLLVLEYEFFTDGGVVADADDADLAKVEGLVRRQWGEEARNVRAAYVARALKARLAVRALLHLDDQVERLQSAIDEAEKGQEERKKVAKSADSVGWIRMSPRLRLLRKLWAEKDGDEGKKGGDHTGGQHYGRFYFYRAALEKALLGVVAALKESGGSSLSSSTRRSFGEAPAEAGGETETRGSERTRRGIGKLRAAVGAALEIGSAGLVTVPLTATVAASQTRDGAATDHGGSENGEQPQKHLLAAAQFRQVLLGVGAMPSSDGDEDAFTFITTHYDGDGAGHVDCAKFLDGVMQACRHAERDWAAARQRGNYKRLLGQRSLAHDMAVPFVHQFIYFRSHDEDDEADDGDEKLDMSKHGAPGIALAGAELSKLPLVLGGRGEGAGGMVGAAARPAFLWLDGNSLTAIPPEILQLKSLRLMTANGNAITRLPVELSRCLTGLRVLQLRDNALEALPEAALTHCAHLRELDLDGNQLRTLPAALGARLPDLRVLSLRGNRLGPRLPPQVFEGMASLRHLHLGRNPALAQLPSSANGLFGLRTLEVQATVVSDVPALLGRLPRLEQVVAHEARLQTIDNFVTTDVAAPSTLVSLSVHTNVLSELPENVSALGALKMLACHTNRLVQLPASMGDGLANLVTLDCRFNALRALPPSFSGLAALRTCLLQGNRLGSGGSNIMPFPTNLRELTLSDNGLETLPDSLGQLTALVSLSLSQNRLESLPSAAFAAMPALDELFVHSNPLESEIAGVVARGLFESPPDRQARNGMRKLLECFTRNDIARMRRAGGTASHSKARAGAMTSPRPTDRSASGSGGGASKKNLLASVVPSSLPLFTRKFLSALFKAFSEADTNASGRLDALSALACAETAAHAPQQRGASASGNGFVTSTSETTALLRLGLVGQAPSVEIDYVEMVRRLGEMGLSCDTKLLRYIPKPNVAVAVRRFCQFAESRRNRAGAAAKCGLRSTVERHMTPAAATKDPFPVSAPAPAPSASSPQRQRSFSARARRGVPLTRRSDELASSLAKNAQLKSEMNRVSTELLSQNQRVQELEDRLLDAWTNGEFGRAARSREEAATLAAAAVAGDGDREDTQLPAREDIHSRLGRMKLLVATPSNSTVMSVFVPADATATVASLKAAVEAQHGVPPCAQILVNKHGKRMDAWRTIASYDVRDGDKVLLATVW